MKSFCIQFKPGNNPKQLLSPLAAKLQISGDLEIETLATAFCDLQEKRHEADYDHTRVITRNEAFNACDQADEAIKAWHAVRVRKPEAVSFFATALLLWPSLSSR